MLFSADGLSVCRDLKVAFVSSCTTQWTSCQRVLITLVVLEYCDAVVSEDWSDISALLYNNNVALAALTACDALANSGKFQVSTSSFLDHTEMK